MYNPEYTQEFYDAYGVREWDRLEATAYGRLKAIIHTDFIETYVKSDDRVLDAGCGPGRFTVVMAQLGAQVTALDISPGQLELARATVSDAGVLDRVDDFVHGDIIDLSRFEDATFDVTICYGGALSYVSERAPEAVAELVRVTKPGGVILSSVMSRYGATANLIRSPEMPVLLDPEGVHLWSVLDTGDLPGFESKSMGGMHPAMRMYSSEMLVDLFQSCEVLELAASCATVEERSPAIEQIAENPKAWETAVEVERRLCRMPGLVDGGSHIIVVVRRLG